MNRPAHRIALIYLFDTCTRRCGYCAISEGGYVLDATQLKAFHNRRFIDSITRFFNKRTTKDVKWNILLTGGEPLLMPNLPRFYENLAVASNCVSIYTGLHIGKQARNLRYLLDEGAVLTNYIMATFHPEDDPDPDRFFRKIAALKKAGHSVLVRFVGHPRRLHLLDSLSERCRQLDICFYPTNLFSRSYPQAYSDQERRLLTRHFTSLSQYIMLLGGLDTTELRCHAGNNLVSVVLQTAMHAVTPGHMSPCILTPTVELGNVLEDRMEYVDTPGPCPVRGVSCNCDIHFQQNIVLGFEDGDEFERQKKGFVEPWDEDKWKKKLSDFDVRLSGKRCLVGQTVDDQTLIYDKKVLRHRLTHVKNARP